MSPLDLARLGAWLDTIGFASGEPLAATALATGRSNVTYVIERGDRRAVLRRPAAVALARADDGMRREFTLLRALDGTPVPHPAPIALGDDPSVLGSVFYLMSFVDGFAPSEPLPGEWDYAAARRSIALSAVETIAALHAVDWRGRGLDALGRIEDFHARQRRRWLAQYES